MKRGGPGKGGGSGPPDPPLDTPMIFISEVNPVFKVAVSREVAQQALFRAQVVRMMVKSYLKHIKYSKSHICYSKEIGKTVPLFGSFIPLIFRMIQQQFASQTNLNACNFFVYFKEKTKKIVFFIWS